MGADAASSFRTQKVSQFCTDSIKPPKDPAEGPLHLSHDASNSPEQGAWAETPVPPHIGRASFPLVPRGLRDLTH